MTVPSWHSTAGLAASLSTSTNLHTAASCWQQSGAATFLQQGWKKLVGAALPEKSPHLVLEQPEVT